MGESDEVYQRYKRGPRMSAEDLIPTRRCRSASRNSSPVWRVSSLDGNE